MDKEQFIKMLESHDWSYRRSDDPSVYRKGEKSKREIYAAKRDNPELEKVYEYYNERNYPRCVV